MQSSLLELPRCEGGKAYEVGLTGCYFFVMLNLFQHLDDKHSHTVVLFCAFLKNNRFLLSEGCRKAVNLWKILCVHNMQTTTYEISRLRDYSSLFSGQTCERALRKNSVSVFENVFRKYDSHLCDKITVWDYLRYVYDILEKQYQNEYVVKNTFLNTLLLEEYSLDSTIAFSEFRVGDAIADLVLMNGISKAFEIKTELDSDARLYSQLNEYCQLFDECYIVIPKSQLNYYKQKVDDGIGIVVFEETDGKYVVTQKRKARRNRKVSVDVLMRSVRCEEYKQMVMESYGRLPDVNAFEMYEACKIKLSKLSSKKLHALFLRTIKRRYSLTQQLPSFPMETRQMYLSMSMKQNQIIKLNRLYNNIISI